MDGNGNLIGMVTERDLLRPRDGAPSQDRSQWLEFLLGSKGWDDRAGSAQLLSVSDVMTSDVIIASEDSYLEEEGRTERQQLPNRTHPWRSISPTRIQCPWKHRSQRQAVEVSEP